MQRDAAYQEWKKQYAQGKIRLPTTTNSNHRFIRANHYLEHLPKATDERETVAYLMSVLRNVSYPFGGSDPLVPRMRPSPQRGGDPRSISHKACITSSRQRDRTSSG